MRSRPPRHQADRDRARRGRGRAGSAAPVASPTPETATVQQWASLVAPHARDWQDKAAELDEVCLDPDEVVICHLGYMTLDLMAKTVVVELEAAATKPGTPNYLGTPPDEIAGLVQRTIDAAKAVEPAFQECLDTGCNDPYADACLAEGFRMMMAMNDVTEAFTAWEPYL